jgi:predicted RND superfamily exporter protein
MVLPILVWYFISDLKFQAQMGIFLAIILTTNVILAITLHPLMIHVVKPRFMRRRGRAMGPGEDV